MDTDSIQRLCPLIKGSCWPQHIYFYFGISIADHQNTDQIPRTTRHAFSTSTKSIFPAAAVKEASCISTAAGDFFSIPEENQSNRADKGTEYRNRRATPAETRKSGPRLYPKRAEEHTQSEPSRLSNRYMSCHQTHR